MTCGCSGACGTDGCRSDESSGSTILDRVATVLLAEATAVARVRVGNPFIDAVLTIEDAGGKVLTTGMGKAGHVARKIASTLSSTGTPASYLHPGEAAHGDLGLVEDGDVVIAFSASGKTREVLECIEGARHIADIRVVAVTSHPDADLRGLADVVIDMGEIHEPCPVGLTPSASSTVMMAIGDAVALALMERRGFGREDFGERHHGGYLGQKSRET